MHGMNGYEFVKQVKQINPKVKAATMTSLKTADKEFSNVLSDRNRLFDNKTVLTHVIRNLVVKLSTKRVH
jgi:two-component SAPR family response regulator